MERLINFRTIRRFVIPYVMVLPATVLVLGIMGYAIAVAVKDSLHDYPRLMREGPFVGIENYVDLISNPQFQESFNRTIVFVGTSVILGLVLSFALALVLYALYKTRLGGFLRVSTLIPYLISGVAAATMWRFLFSGQAGMINHILGTVGLPTVRWLSDGTNALIVVILANTWKIFPMSTLLLLSGLLVIDPQLYDAAKVDGSSDRNTFFRITIPLVSPYLATALIWLTFASFNMFAVIFPLTQGGPLRATEVLALYMYRVAFDQLNFADGSAIMIMLLLINVFFSVFFILIFRKRD